MVKTCSEFLLRVAKKYIPTKWAGIKTSCHPWITKTSRKIIAARGAAEGTDGFSLLQEACSQQLREDYGKYVVRTKVKINSLSENPKQWWKLLSSLLLKTRSSNGIPPVQGAEGVWARSQKEKLISLEKLLRVNLHFQVLKYMSTPPLDHFSSEASTISEGSTCKINN